MPGPLDHTDLSAQLREARHALEAGAVAEAARDLESVYERALGARDRAVEAEALVALARALRAQGSVDQATVCLDQAFEAARAAGLPAVQADARFVEVELLVAGGNDVLATARLVEAAHLLDAAQATARATGDATLALSLGDRAREARDRVIERLGRHEPHRPIAAKALAAQEDRRREEERRLRDDLLEGLSETSRRLVAERDPERVLVAVLEGAVSALGAERGFILFPRDPGAPAGEDEASRELPGGLRVAAARNFDHAAVRHPAFKVSRTVIEKVLATRRPVLVADALADAELAGHASIDEQRVRALVVVPIENPRAEGQVGVLYLDNRHGEATFSSVHLPALAAFAAHAAVAVESARLHLEAERQNRELDRARSRAEELARKLEAELSRTGDELVEVKTRLSAVTQELERSGFGELVGGSHAMQQLYRLLEKVKEADLPVLIEGESGSGKELVARAVHFESSRRKEPFVSENCAAIPETLLESELFGHEPGAFTGAVSRRKGIFELAGRGTLFLDEVGELTPSCQAKLLRVLQEKRIRRVGGTEEISVAARVLCATNRDLQAMVRAGTFREDLFYRLNAVTVRVPPLRERCDDIPALVEKLLARVRPATAPPVVFSREALRALVDHAWPGNVRELENELKRLAALAGERIEPGDLSPKILGAAPASSSTALPRDGPAVAFREGERWLLVNALRAAKGDRAKAAGILGLPRGTVWRKMKQHKIGDADVF